MYYHIQMTYLLFTEKFGTDIQVVCTGIICSTQIFSSLLRRLCSCIFSYYNFLEWVFITFQLKFCPAEFFEFKFWASCENP
jgi:hypothetical protein